MELLCARLCHDLIGPISAVNNGVELVRDFGDEMKGEALDLIGDSALRASRLLQFYRVAFGSARAPDGSGISISEARQRALEALTSERVAVHWPQDSVIQGAELPRSVVKLALNMVLLGAETLPGAGDVDVDFQPGGRAEIRVTARKEGIALTEDIVQVLTAATDEDALTPQNIQAFLTRFLAESAAKGINVETSAADISFLVELKP
jgi:histidine phosphotransferase ChpT